MTANEFFEGEWHRVTRSEDGQYISSTPITLSLCTDELCVHEEANL